MRQKINIKGYDRLTEEEKVKVNALIESLTGTVDTCKECKTDNEVKKTVSIPIVGEINKIDGDMYPDLYPYQKAMDNSFVDYMTFMYRESLIDIINYFNTKLSVNNEVMCNYVDKKTKGDK